jgi:phosphatidylglycerophosphatase A
MAREPLSPKLLLDPVHFLALGCGAGLSPWAPGTAGSLVALAIAFVVPRPALAWALGLAAVIIAAGIWICGASARKLGIHDPPAIVLDEIVAMFLLTIIIPRELAWYAAAFALFRFFDIVKPWPIRDLDHRLSGGLGIMLDDLVAALFAGACLWVTENVLTAI